MALAQFGTRFKIGFHHAQLIEYFLDRATNPSLEKLAAHYPEHPRPGAPELHPGCDLGRCIINALNIKRGYWRLPRQVAPAGISPFGSTPESVGGGVGGGSGSTSGASNAAGGQYRPGSGSIHSMSLPSGTGTGTEENSPNHILATSTADTFPNTANTYPFYTSDCPISIAQPQHQSSQQQQQTAPIQQYPPPGSLRAKERGGASHSLF